MNRCTFSNRTATPVKSQVVDVPPKGRLVIKNLALQVPIQKEQASFLSNLNKVLSILFTNPAGDVGLAGKDGKCISKDAGQHASTRANKVTEPKHSLH